MAVTIVITKEDLIQLIEDCYSKKCRKERLDCLEMVAKLILVAVKRTKEREGEVGESN